VKELAKKGEVVKEEQIVAAAPEICGGKYEKPCSADSSCLVGYHVAPATRLVAFNHVSNITSCKGTHNQWGYHCKESFDGSRANNHNGWAFYGKASDVVYILDSKSPINRMDILSGKGRQDYRINDFNIFYSTSADPSLNGAEWEPLTNVDFNNNVTGGAIFGNTITLTGQHTLDLTFDAVQARAVRLHVRGTDAPNDNLVLTEIDLYHVVKGATKMCTPCGRVGKTKCAAAEDGLQQQPACAAGAAYWYQKAGGFDPTGAKATSLQRADTKDDGKCHACGGLKQPYCTVGAMCIPGTVYNPSNRTGAASLAASTATTCAPTGSAPSASSALPTMARSAPLGCSRLGHSTTRATIGSTTATPVARRTDLRARTASSAPATLAWWCR
jgi:hypothetical protein